MTRRVCEPLRNLDDTLRVFHLLTFRSCGIVLVLFSASHGLEWATRIWSGLFGDSSFVVELALALVVAIALAVVERQEDEFFVPSAVRYYAERIVARVPVRLAAGRLLGSLLVYVAADVVETAFHPARAAFGPLGILAPAFCAGAWLASRPWPPMGPVVFSGMALSAPPRARLTEGER